MNQTSNEWRIEPGVIGHLLTTPQGDEISIGDTPKAEQLMGLICRRMNEHEQLMEALKGIFNAFDAPHRFSMGTAVVDARKTVMLIAEADKEHSLVMLLARVATALQDVGVLASIEYPGYLQVENDRDDIFAFGFANGPFGWNLVDNQGRNIQAGETSHFLPDAEVESLAAYVISVINTKS